MCEKITLTPLIKELMKSIIERGYECYLVGGAVRDFILNVENKDFDFATNMPLEKLKEINPSIIVMKENEHRNTAILRTDGRDYEFSSYRGKTIYDDLENRDFRLNSIAVNYDGKIIDPFNGLADISNKTISLTKENGDGLVSDPLRILRAIRQSIKYDFKIDGRTFKKMNDKRNLLTLVAEERIITELKKILVADNVDYYLDKYRNIFFVIIPELEKCNNLNQLNDYHIYDLYTHIIKVVKNTDSVFELRLAGLFHDIGKPEKMTIDENGIGHFLGHAIISKDIFNKFAIKYKLDNKTKKIVSDLILHHEDELSVKPNKIYNFYKKFNMDRIEILINLKIADVKSQNPKYIDRIDKLLKVEEKYIYIRNKYNQITYNGDNLIELGYTGKRIGFILDDIKRQIINNRLNNNYEDINNYVIKKFEREEIR